MLGNWIERILILSCLFFAVTLSLFHVSFDGYLGLSKEAWEVVWGVSENGLSLMMCIIISIYTINPLRVLFRFVFVPYFALKMIYHFTCFSGIYLLAEDTWKTIWSFACVGLIIAGLILIRKKYVA